MWKITKPSEYESDALANCTTYYRDGGLLIISPYRSKFRSFVYIDRIYKESITDCDLEVVKLKSLLCLEKHGFKVKPEDFKEIIE